MINNKSLLLGILGLLLVMVFVGNVCAEDIAYVVADSSHLDSNFITAINELGYSYEVIGDRDAGGVDFSDYEMILIGNENIYNAPVHEYKSLIVNPNHYKEFSGNLLHFVSNYPLSAYAPNPNFIVGDLNVEEDFDIYTSCCFEKIDLPVYTLTGRKYDTQRIISKSGSGVGLGQFVIGVKGDPKRVFFGITESEYWTPESKELFKNSIEWLINGPDEVTINEPPEFEELDCVSEILEDSEYSCELEGSDEESDDFEFSIVNGENLECSIDGNTLSYSGEEDYFGDASCLIKVSDEFGYSEHLFEVEIENVNDAPNIVSTNPSLGFVRILQGTSKLFRVNVLDDSGFSLSWFINDELVGVGEDYLFEEEKGNYDLKCIVEDSEYSVESEWEVLVDDFDNFTCSEINGVICVVDEICEGDLFNVRNSDRCCQGVCVDGPPQFSKIKRDGILNKNINVKITEPDEDDEFEINEEIKIEVNIENDFNEEIDFDVDAYLYNLDKNRIVERVEDEVEIKKKRDEDVDFVITVPSDVDADNDYAIFVKAEGDGYYNEDYVLIDIERKEIDVIIDKISLDIFEDLTCGDSFSIDVEVKNQGSEDQVVRISVENSKLDIDVESEEFELEEFDEEDSESIEFGFDILDNVEAGEYILDVKVLFDREVISEEVVLIVKECISESESILELGNSKDSDIASEAIVLRDSSSKSNMIVPSSTIFIYSLLIIFLIILIIMLWYIIKRLLG
ncbi:hypothetical protein HOD75_01270 [archaeon]|jgi:hypothetical protein|nr:hypothetical protein [archaeon]MBT4241508.1 hypothetical protein [archaeon]MBT4417621.1 hypothetical protein [archaeon]